MSQKVWVIVLVLAVIAAAVFGALEYRKRGATPKQGTNYVAIEKLPERFPSDFPVEAGAKILSNYNYEKDGVFQSTRQFESQKTLAENYEIYKEYLGSNGWTVNSNMNLATSKFLLAIKDGSTVSINISANSFTGQNVVDISFVFNK